MDERMKKQKRCMARCTAMLLIPVMALLTACGNAVVDITYDEAETQEEAVSDSEKVYELFLNGELTVELEEEQVTIDELFWNNDIEYCFGDIDGDGSEELHIRDDVVYYAIKARDGMLQILFEGWWNYELVVTDEACGILHFTDNKYNFETIQFITINTDGSTESDGEFHWFDESKNGIMNEEDAYINLNYPSYEEIDMEQYVQYREEQIAKQTENELEWIGKRLKKFATWQEAYIDFLSKPTVWVSKDCPECSLVYVDNDEVPELYIEVGGAAGGTIVSFYDGNVRAMNRDRGGIQYIEYGGLFYSDWGNTGFYPCDVYVLEKGEFSEIGTGWLSENNDAEKGFLGFDYFWEGSLMTETEYKECLNKLIDTSQCIRPDEVYTKDEILEILEEWEGMRRRQNKIALQGRVLLEKPIVNWNGEEGELRYDWFENILQVGEDTFLFVSDCCFPEEKLQQRAFYLAQAPDFVPQEVFRQDSRVFNEEPYGASPEFLERRMPCPERVEAGYVYEADGLLYCLDEEFKESVLLCNLRELMGEYYLFSPWIPDENKCDVSADATRLLACTDEGLYEYNLESKGKTLLESAVLIPQEIEHIEGDCDCGETGFEFDGPIAAEYVPGEQGYAFLTGEEYGGATGVTLRSAEGETLYQREIEGYIGDFRWIESEDAVYLAVFYRENGSAWMERVDVHTGEKEVFAVPDEVFWDNNLSVGFLDADHLIYCSKQVSEARERDHTSKSRYDICALSDEEIKMPVNAEDIYQQIIVFTGGYSKIIVKWRNNIEKGA